MIFPVDPETARWTQKTISRLRGRRDWSSVCTREACWTPAFLSALIDEVDCLLTAGLGKEAYEISRHLGLLVERIRAEECPQNELGKRSLSIWAMAAHGSSCRQSSLFAECERTFADALGRLECGVLPWASADLFRRYAALLAQRSDRSAFYFIEEALAGFVDLPERTAETLTLRGVIRHQIDQDSSSAIERFHQSRCAGGPGTRRTFPLELPGRPAQHRLSIGGQPRPLFRNFQAGKADVAGHPRLFRARNVSAQTDVPLGRRFVVLPVWLESSCRAAPQ